MPGKSKTEGSEIEKRCSGSASKKALEFKAEIIPYDTGENPNSPILAVSGDNVNIIFNIPKENFRKLAIAAIGQLDHDSDFKLSETSASGQSNCCKCKISVNNTNGDMNASGDVIETENSKDKNGIFDHELYENITSVTEKIDASNRSHCNGLKFNNESSSSDHETEKSTENNEMVSHFKEASNEFRSIFENSRISDSSSSELARSLSENGECDRSKTEITDIPNVNDYAQCESKNSLRNGKTECSEDNEKAKKKFNELNENKIINQDLNTKDFSAENCEALADEANLSAHNIDISNDYSKLEKVWPDIHPFAETEVIPIKELKSLELNGALTKFLKLQISNDVVVLKLTSSSNVFVDAVKYRETGKDSIVKSEDNSIHSKSSSPFEKEPEESYICDVCRKTVLLTAVNNLHVDSIEEMQKISETDENESAEHKDEKHVSKAATEKSGSEFSDENSTLHVESLKPQNLKSEDLISTSNKLLNASLSNIACTSDDNLKNSSEVGSEIVQNLSANASSNNEECDSDDETTEHIALVKDSAKQFENIKIKNIDSERYVESASCRTRENIRKTNEIEESDNDAKMNCESNCEIDVKDEQSEEVVAEKRDSEEEISVKNSKLDPENTLVKNFNDEKEALSKNVSIEYLSRVSLKTPEEKLNHESYTSDENLEHSEKFEEIKEQDENSEEYIKTGMVEISEASQSSENPNNKCELNASSEIEASDDIKNDAESEESAVIKVEVESDDENIPDENLKQFQNGHEKIKVLNENSETFKTKEMEMDEISEALESSKENSENKCELSSSEIGSNNEIKDIGMEDAESENISQESTDTCVEGNLNPEKNISNKNLGHSEVVEEIKELNKHSEEYENLQKIENVKISEASQSSEENKCELSTSSDVESIDDIKVIKNGDLESEKISEESGNTRVEIGFKEAQFVDKESFNEANSKCFENKSFTESSEYIENDSILNSTVESEMKLPENSFASSGDSLMDSTVETNVESMSDGGELESDDIKSVASESDDSKDGEKHNVTTRKGRFAKNKYKADEVDCAPTRVRMRKAISGLSKDAIPEHAEVKNAKGSKTRSTLNVTSKQSGITSTIGRSLRSKSLDPTPQSSKVLPHDKAPGVLESEEMRRKARATTPDIIGKKDIKTTMRASPRKLARSAATESSSTSKVQSTKTNVADTHSKSRGNVDSPISTSKRSKRGSKD